MGLASLSFPLFSRCRGVVNLTQALERNRVRIEPDDLPGPAAPPPGEPLEPLYIVDLPDAFVTHAGACITRDSFLVEQLSRHLRNPIATHRQLRAFRLFRKIRRVPGTVVSLVAPCQYNYYHWMLEVLPKLELFRLHRPAPPDAFYYVETYKPFQAESLQLLGLDPSRLIDSRRTQIVQARRLLAATIPGPSGVAHPWAVGWLRRRFAEAVKDDPALPAISCLVISRRNAKNRRILNEDALLASLAHLHPVVATLENLSVAEQIGLFRRANIVIAPHGAGLTNIAFARPGCHLLEIFGGEYRNPCYERLAQVAGCRYTALVNEDVRDEKLGELNIRVLLKNLEQAVAGPG